MALVPLTDGSMNMVLVVMPTLLSVLTLSAGIHVANYWKHAAARDPKTAIVETVKMARTPCALASFTTAIGLVSLMTSPLVPVRDLGLYSAIGCLISLAVVLFGLPALLQLWPARQPTFEEIDRTSWRRFGAVLFRHRRLIIAASLMLFVGGTWGLSRFRTETRVIRFFPDDARVVQDYDFLEEHLAGITPVDVVVRFDAQAQEEIGFLERLELVRQVQDRMREHPQISGSLSLADFQPEYQPPADDVSLPQRLAFNRGMYELERRVKDEETGARAFITVADQRKSLEVASGRWLTIDEGDELWRITAQASVMSDYSYADLVGDWRAPHEVRGELNEVAASVLADQPGASHVITGMVPLFLRTQEAVLDSLISSFGLAFCVIALVMMVLLRHPVAGLITMLPNLLPIGVVFGLISWGGMAVDIGTMITASVALGIAVDGTLHLLTWFKHGLEAGLNRQDAISQALSRCGPAMWQTSAAVGLGLLVMTSADFLLISRFGWLMASLIGLALLSDIVLLPALLAGSLGGMIEGTLQRAAARRAARAEAAEAAESGLPAGQPVPAMAGMQMVSVDT
ncbi:MAG: MMPL family transporter, partial [Planctomycetes bacterium]|nr:MMPL family transporter [Planctomycetota bacterium]